MEGGSALRQGDRIEVNSNPGNPAMGSSRPSGTRTAYVRPNPRVPSAATDSTLGYFRAYPTGSRRPVDLLNRETKVKESQRVLMRMGWAFCIRWALAVLVAF